MNSGNSHDAVLSISASRQLVPWMLEHGLSLAFTTYKAGKLFFVSPGEDGQLAIFERTFPRCMGLLAVGQSLYLSTRFQLWKLRNVVEPGQTQDSFDSVFVPQMAWTTGDLDIHDIALTATDQPIFVNTLFSCLATISEDHSFVPLWHPPFITRLAAEDRCHLNGLAMRDGKPAYASALGATDVADGWRERRAAGGVVIDIIENEIVAAGLSMPHSPRWRDGRLWIHQSGHGEFGYIDLATGKFVPVTFCPGYLRGLDFVGNCVIAGLSNARHDQTFAGIPLHDRLQEKNVAARTGIQVIDLNSGDAPHWLRIEGDVIHEIYDVAVLPGVLKPRLVGISTDEICRVLSVGRSA